MTLFQASLPPPPDADEHWWLQQSPEAIEWQALAPDSKHNWKQPLSADFEAFIPLFSSNNKTEGIFATAFLGISDKLKNGLEHTDKKETTKLAKAFIKNENKKRVAAAQLSNSFEAPVLLEWDSAKLREFYDAPFVKKWCYDAHAELPIFAEQTAFLVLPQPHAHKTFYAFVTDKPVAAHFIDHNLYLPFCRSESNLNPWAVQQFRAHYTASITTEKIAAAARALVPAAAFLPSLSDLAQKTAHYTQHIKTWSEENEAALEEQIKQLNTKTALLGKGAREKKRLFDLLQQAIDYFKQILAETSEAQQARQKLENLDGIDVLHYTYALLHCPNYRATYARHLQYDLPRLPFYPDFWTWVKMGKELLELHLGWQQLTAPAFDLLPEPPASKFKPKIDSHKNLVYWDEQSILQGLDNRIHQHKLGNKTAVEWAFQHYNQDKENGLAAFLQVCAMSAATEELVKDQYMA